MRDKLSFKEIVIAIAEFVCALSCGAIVITVLMLINPIIN